MIALVRVLRRSETFLSILLGSGLAVASAFVLNRYEESQTKLAAWQIVSSQIAQNHDRLEKDRPIVAQNMEAFGAQGHGFTIEIPRKLQDSGYRIVTERALIDLYPGDQGKLNDYYSAVDNYNGDCALISQFVANWWIPDDARFTARMRSFYRSINSEASILETRNDGTAEYVSGQITHLEKVVGRYRHIAAGLAFIGFAILAAFVVSISGASRLEDQDHFRQVLEQL